MLAARSSSRRLAAAARRSLHSVPDSLGAIGARRFDLNSLDRASLAALRRSQSTGKPLSKGERNDIARQVGRWALTNGAVNFAHWFSPLRGKSALKRDAFLAVDFSNGSVSPGFSGTQLFSSETDGSSFPNGGLRVTHRAAAFLSWDTRSTPWIRGDTLYVPAAFVTHNGEPLDEKTPLLRSEDAVSREAARLVKLMGFSRPNRVISNVGWEHEFFAVDRDMYLQRPDLVATGRTVLGRLSRLNQAREENYFSLSPSRTDAMLRDVQAELWELGVPMSVYHGEVAPSQHELSPVFSPTSQSSDENQLAMEVLDHCAERHNLKVLHHEKPFAGINGSGKHCNYSLNLEDGTNLHSPGSTRREQERFVAMVASTAYAIRHHGDLLRIAVASASNDHRLGAQEAPPPVLSLSTGENLEAHLRAVVAGGPLAGYDAKRTSVSFGSPAVQPVPAGAEDRNRTAPFPFCGNRWEFRAVGSTHHMGLPMSFLNTALADGMAHISDRIEAGAAPRDAVADTLGESFDAIFSGDGYSTEWHQEAERRGLPSLQTTADAVAELTSDKNVTLLAKYGVLEEEVTRSRANVYNERYFETVLLEAAVQREMLDTGVVPATRRDTTGGGKTAWDKRKAAAYDEVVRQAEALGAAVDAAHQGDRSPAEAARYAADVLKPAMDAARAAADSVEEVLPADLAAYPNYEDLLFSHHGEASM